MFTVLAILILIIGLLLSAIILAQAPKGDGLSGALGAPGGMGTMFGVRRAADFLVKATVALAVLFVFFCLVANIFFLPSATPGSAANPLREGPAPTASPVPSIPGESAPGTAPIQQAPAK